MVEVLRYKPEGRGFDYPMVSPEFFTHTIALGPTQPPTEISNRTISWKVKEASALG